MRLDYTKVQVLQDAFASLVNNQFLSDIKFKFADGRIIFAHSFVLCCRSDEFCDSFETTVGVSKLIQVQNSTYEEYLEFLKYLYTDSCKIDESTLTSVLQLSKKHELPGLETKCTDVMLADMSVENVCTILGRSIELELESLRSLSTKFIAENYIAALNAESFLKIRDEALKAILELELVSDDDEFNVFKATMKWAEKACLKDGLEASGDLKRQVLGDNLKLLRFGAMTCAEFAACIKLEPDLLTKEEIISTLTSLTVGEKNSFEIAGRKRKLILGNFDNVGLRDTLNDGIWKNNSRLLPSTNISMTFSVSRSIAIEKFDLFYTGILMIRFVENFTIVYEGPDFNNFLTKKVLHANTHYTIYVTFKDNYKMLRSNKDLKFQSKGGKCEFTIYENSCSVIKNLTFKF